VTPSPQLSDAERKAVVSAFKDLEHTQGHGITLSGTKYFTIKAEEISVYGKKAVCTPVISLPGLTD
jgi:Profilin